MQIWRKKTILAGDNLMCNLWWIFFLLTASNIYHHLVSKNPSATFAKYTFSLWPTQNSFWQIHIQLLTNLVKFIYHNKVINNITNVTQHLYPGIREPVYKAGQHNDFLFFFFYFLIVFIESAHWADSF